MARVVVLIHGYGFDQRVWLPVELAFEGFHVVHLSLPGFGDEEVEGEYSIAGLANRFWQEIDPHIAPVVHLAGMSMGGYVVMEMAAQQPHRVQSVALVHSHVFADSPEKKDARTATLELISTKGREAVASKMIPSLFAHPDSHKEIIDMLVRRGIQYSDQAWSYGTLAMRDRRDHADTLSALKVPVLMLMGEKDKAVPVDIALRQSHLAERTVLHLYPETGHLGMYEQSDLMIRDLVRFYQSIEP